MTDHVIGIVSKITSKEAGKNNNLIYSCCIEEDGRDDEWYGYGWDEPDFTEGAEIEFDIEYNGDFLNIDPKSVSVIRDGAPKRSSRSSGRSSGRASGGNRNSGRSNSSSRSSGRSNTKPAGRGKPAAKANDTTMSKDDWAKKDQMIRRQACMNTAIKLVTLMQVAGVLPKPTKKSEGFDALAALCDEEAERLYNQYEEQVYGGGKSKRGSSTRDQAYDDDIPE